MTKEELKKHCLKQVEACEMWAKHNGEEPHGKVYEEHELILELLEQDSVLDKIRAEMFEEMLSHSGTGEIVIQAYADGLKKGLKIIDKYKIESEERMPPERDCVNCVNSKDGHMDFSETCHNCMWENQFIPKFMPKRIKASDIKPDDEWMQEDVWDEIYKQEDNLPDINVGNIKESEDKE